MNLKELKENNILIASKLEKRGVCFSIVMDNYNCVSDVSYTEMQSNYNLALVCSNLGGSFLACIEHAEEPIIDMEELRLVEVFPELLEKAERKKPHFHAVMSFARQVRVQTLYKEICDVFGTPCVSYTQDGEACLNQWVNLQVGRSETALVRYLVHKDNPEKWQYDESKIITNDTQRVQYALALESAELTIDDLCRIAVRCDYDLVKIYRCLPLSVANKYRNIIKDVVKFGVPQLPNRKISKTA